MARLVARSGPAFWGFPEPGGWKGGIWGGSGGKERLFLLRKETNSGVGGGGRRGLYSFPETISVQLPQPETRGTRSGKPSSSSRSGRGVAPWRLLLFAVSHALRCRLAQARIHVYSGVLFVTFPVLSTCTWRECPFSVHFSSVSQSCPTLCDPMNCSTPGLPVHHQLPEFTQTHVHWVGDAIQPSHPLSSPSAFNLSQHRSLFKWVSSSHLVAKILEFQLQHQSFQWTLRTDFL